MVKDLVEQGHRPSRAVGLSLEELRALNSGSVAASPSSSSTLGYGLSVQQRATEIRAGVLLKTEKLDATGIEELLEASWQQLGAIDTLEQVVAPLLTSVGQRWQAGRFGIHHEHLFSARVSAFLTRHWMPASDRASGPMVVMATPPGEEHLLGLHIAAAYFATEGARVLFLGQNVPAESLLEAASDAQAQALALSVSVLYPQQLFESYLAQLLRVFAPTQILVGGDGAFTRQWPCVQLSHVHDVRAWLASSATSAHRGGSWQLQQSESVELRH